MNQKKQKKLKKRRKYIRKIDWKNKFAAARVKIFLVNPISGNKSVIFFGLIYNCNSPVLRNFKFVLN